MNAQPTAATPVVIAPAKKQSTVVNSIKNTVTTAADTVTGVISTTNNAIGMLTRSVNDASTRQNIRSNMDMVIFKSTIQTEKAQELAESRLKGKQYMEQSAVHESLFKDAFAELQGCL